MNPLRLAEWKSVWASLPKDNPPVAMLGYALFMRRGFYGVPPTTRGLPPVAKANKGTVAVLVML